ncbi:hypothetical protein ACFVU3_39785 [Streptomyces sp. NPDC058052]|uniref:hypothetical protein n=1 Tax=Streptomyces sp. NPDC058052 TaxID=3346316 RepID=UPI0036EAA7AE
MSMTPITIHLPPPPRGRRVTAHRHGHDDTLSMAYSHHDLMAFLDRADVPDPETALDDPAWAEWREGRAHQWDAA